MSYSALIGGVVLPGIIVIGLAVIPFVDRQRRHLGLWLGDAQGKWWSGFGAVFGLAATVLALFLGVTMPVRELFPGIESQLFFDLVNPATLLLGLFVVLFFGVYSVTKSTRYASLATFCAFIVSFALLTYAGTALRGPNWEFYWPWQPWPHHPNIF